MIWIAVSAIWISMAGLVGYAVHLTGNSNLLWFMLIPVIMTAGAKSGGKGTKTEGAGEDE